MGAKFEHSSFNGKHIVLGSGMTIRVTHATSQKIPQCTERDEEPRSCDQVHDKRVHHSVPARTRWPSSRLPTPYPPGDSRFPPVRQFMPPMPATPPDPLSLPSPAPLRWSRCSRAGLRDRIPRLAQVPDGPFRIQGGHDHRGLAERDSLHHGQVSMDN